MRFRSPRDLSKTRAASSNRAEAFVVCDCVLNNKSFYALRVRKCHAKTNGAAVILHVKRVPRESERFGEVIGDLSDVIERVREFFRIRPVAVPKPG